MKRSIASIAILGLALSNSVSLVSGKEGGNKLSQATSKTLAGISSRLFLAEEAQLEEAVVIEETAVIEEQVVEEVAQEEPEVVVAEEAIAEEAVAEEVASDAAVLEIPVIAELPGFDESVFADVDFDSLKAHDFDSIAAQIDLITPVDFKSEAWIS